jgi:predicted metal-dependent hydrolase
MSAANPAMAQLALLDGAAAPEDEWRVRTSERARRLAVRVLPGGLVEIVVPRGTRPRVIEHFVTRHRPWIDRKLAQYRPLDRTTGDGLPECIQFAANGESFDVQYTEAPGAPRLTVEGRTIRMSGQCARNVFMRHALQRFAMRRAHRVLSPWLADLSLATGLPYERLQIRRQRTRWGSCSRNGTISLNVCLLFQSPDVVKYLLVHELAHTRHMNHSARFWALVGRIEPRWRELDAELTHGWRDVPAWILR